MGAHTLKKFLKIIVLYKIILISISIFETNFMTCLFSTRASMRAQIETKVKWIKSLTIFTYVVRIWFQFLTSVQIEVSLKDTKFLS